jgi:hypothetical protein
MCGDVAPMSGGGLQGGGDSELGNNIINLAIPIGFVLAQHALMKTRTTAAQAAKTVRGSTKRTVKVSAARSARQSGGSDGACGMCFSSNSFTGGGLFNKLDSLQNSIETALH